MIMIRMMDGLELGFRDDFHLELILLYQVVESIKRQLTINQRMED